MVYVPEGLIFLVAGDRKNCKPSVQYNLSAMDVLFCQYYLKIKSKTAVFIVQPDTVAETETSVCVCVCVRESE